jgi:Nuclease-related domain/UvrD-like helicase C-terminal domain/AAA domain
MALLIPQKNPKTSGERRVAKLLQRLPDDWLIYYEPTIGDRRPDFIVMAPALGLLIIEVKSWKLRTVKSATSKDVHLTTAQGTVAKKHPLDQAQSYVCRLMDACRNDLWGRSLVHQDGPHRGALVFPVGKLVIFDGFTHEEVSKSGGDAIVWEKVFPPDKCVLSDVLTGWEGMADEVLPEAFVAFFTPFRLNETLSKPQVDVLRSVIFPEIRLSATVPKGSGLGRTPMAQLKVLDAKQEIHARSLGSGHRLLFGVAGSGKTVLLVARARWLLRQQPGASCLFLCYNVVLAAWLRDHLADCPGIKIRHFDAWARECGVTRAAREDDASLGARLLERLRARPADAPSYNCVLIDEAQDFEPDWFRSVLRSMKDPVNGDLVIVADGSQGVYKRGRVSWKEIGIQAAGRTISSRYDLQKNYRNTRQIAAVARGFGLVRDDAEGVSAMVVTPERCERDEGVRPALIRADSRVKECDAARHVISQWLEGNFGGRNATPLQPEEIGVLYPKIASRDGGVMSDFLAQLSTIAPVVWLTDRNDKSARTRVAEPGIKVQTIYSAKGLQYRGVVVLWTDALPDGRKNHDERESERRLLYVALTRAESLLVMTCSRAHGFATELSRMKSLHHALAADMRARRVAGPTVGMTV